MTTQNKGSSINTFHLHLAISVVMHSCLMTSQNYGGLEKFVVQSSPIAVKFYGISSPAHTQTCNMSNFYSKKLSTNN